MGRKESKLRYSGNLARGEPQRTDRKCGSVCGQRDRGARRGAGDAGADSGGKTGDGGDKGFDTRDFVAECRHLGVTPHVAQNLGGAAGARVGDRPGTGKDGCPRLRHCQLALIFASRPPHKRRCYPQGCNFFRQPPHLKLFLSQNFVNVSHAQS